MATRVTDGARRERLPPSFRPRFARLAASPLPRACIALTKSEEKERLLAVYGNKYFINTFSRIVNKLITNNETRDDN